MRLELGPDGKIIGTRRVSPNGQVSGLSEFSGREVLVILPGSSDSGAGGSWSNGDEMARLVSEQIRAAYDRYQDLQELYATPWEATRSFMDAAFGGRAPNLAEEVDRWVHRQVRSEPGARPTASAPTEKESTAPPKEPGTRRSKSRRKPRT